VGIVVVNVRRRRGRSSMIGKIYRVLVVEDEADHCAMIADRLTGQGGERLEAVFAHSVAEACRILEGEEFDIVLLDHHLPDGHACDILEEMDHRLLTTPVIGLSTSADPQVALADFRGGATDFVQKSDAFEADHLRSRVFEVLLKHKRRMLASLLEQRRKGRGVVTSDEALMAAARIDPLMGILNRAALADVHADLHERARQSGRGYCLCVIDVDRFKTYNDRYGHAAGDEVLRSVALALQATLRQGDLLARYGGEEIVVLLEDVRDADAPGIAARLCACVAALNLPHETSEFGLITVSGGAAVFDPASGESGQGVFDRADRALYEAKSAGRNRAVLSPPFGPSTDRACA
jgi:diguanylate cyclase (GGDEF)-like protein